MAVKNTETSEKTFKSKEKTDEKVLSFSKQAFLSSKGYKPHRDLIEALLENGRSYTKSEVNKMLDDYLKGKVK